MEWLYINQVADLYQLCDRAIREQVYRGCFGEEDIGFHYIKGKGKNGRVMQINSDYLKEPALSRYEGKQHEINLPAMHTFTEKQRTEALYKKDIVLQYIDFKKTSTVHNKLTTFLDLHPEVTKRQLTDWYRKQQQGGVEALVDTRGKHSKGKSTIPDDMWNAFCTFYYDQGDREISLSYLRTCSMFEGQKIPSIEAFKRRMKTVPYNTTVLYREGNQAFNDKCTPAIQRDYIALLINELWVSDHHLFDVHVLGSKGKLVRLWFSVWLEMRSRRVMGYVIREEDPNGDVVLQSFSTAVIRNNGRLPSEVYLDNGKDYKVHDLFNNDNPQSLSNRMHINVRHTEVYHGQSKHIERFFRTIEKYCKHMKSYLGSDAKKRPERLKKMELNEYPTIQEFSKWIDNIVKIYNSRTHSGQGMQGKTPNEVYSTCEAYSAAVPSEVLSLYLQRTTKLLTVTRNGVNFEGIRYVSEDTAVIQKKKVHATYIPNEVSTLFLYDSTDNSYLCKAVNAAMLTYHATTEDIKQWKKFKKAVRTAAKDGITVVPVPSFEEYLQREAFKAVEADIAAGASNVTIVDPMDFKNNDRIKSGTKHPTASSDIVQEYEEVINERRTSQLDVDDLILQEMRKRKGG